MHIQVWMERLLNNSIYNVTRFTINDQAEKLSLQTSKKIIYGSY